VSRPASPSNGSGCADASGTYGGDLTTVNYVDVEFELREGDAENQWEPTETIQPFVKDLCEVSHKSLATRPANAWVLTCCVLRGRT
jgi:hypothetical protein